MDFEILYTALKKKELILLDGAMCRFHKRRDGQVTIHVILSNKPGNGRRIIELLKSLPGTTSIFAKCPSTLESNGFYRHMGFYLECEEVLRTGTIVNHWRLKLREEISC